MESLLILIASVGIGVGCILYLFRHLDWSYKRYVIIATVLITCVGYFGVQRANRADTEIWNGEVTSKTSEHVLCDHSYSCNCRTDSKGIQTCDTCFEHGYDVDWIVRHTAGDPIVIDRVDRQGLLTPSRWEQVRIGEPVAQRHTFINYIKAAEASLFNTEAERKAFAQYEKQIPKYPAAIYDYYHLDRVVTLGQFKLSNSLRKEWNTVLANDLRPLGPKKKVNVVMVFTDSQDPNIAQAVRVAWKGGKKNDVIVVLGTPHYPEVSWAKVFSWSDNESFKIELADELVDRKTVAPAETLAVISQGIAKGYKYKSMEEFSYLAWESTPSAIACLLIAALAFVAAFVLCRIFSTHPRFR